ncbi:MAG: lamin tail domain-containing protein, partial [Saprospiraceae bacterium]
MPPYLSLAKRLLLIVCSIFIIAPAQAQCPQITNSSLSSPSCTPSSSTDLFFSEYIEGSSNNKCLEIYNGTGAAINFASGSYDIRFYNNGAATPNATIALTGTVADGDVYVICHPSAAAPFAAVQDQVFSGVGSYNGNDAVVLSQNGVLLDVIGNIGCNPGGNWNAGGFSTENQTLVRNPDVTTGVGDPGNAGCLFPTLTTEWTNFANNTSSNLGSHTTTGGSGGCCDLCPDDLFTVSVLAGSDLPQGGTINWMASTTPGFDPYSGGTLLGVSNIPTVDCLQSSGFHINEIMARPLNNDGTSGAVGTGEWLELIGAPGTDIGCTVLTDGDWTVTIPPGTTIPADGFYMIGFAGLTPGPVDLDLFTCACTTEAGISVDETFIMSNNGEYIAMFDGTGTFLEGLIFGNPTGLNAPSQGNLAVGGVVPTAAVPGCSLTSVTIPSTGYATISSTPSVNTSYIHAPDATGPWTTQGGGSFDDCNVAATGTFPLELTTSLSSAYCNQTVYITGAINPFPVGPCSTSDPTATTQKFKVCIVCPEEDVSEGSAYFAGETASDVTFPFSGSSPCCV